jgi:hypothetical protein
LSHCNILIGCDSEYYNNWGYHLLKSINHYNNWISLHCHIVNPKNTSELDFVNYSYESINFINENSKISYLQAIRFIVAKNKFDDDDYVMTLDADTICTKSFTKKEFIELFKNQTILQHPKDGRWLAGLVCLGPNEFRSELSNELLHDPVDTWTYGRDQVALEKLSKKYNFEPVSKYWISIGKNGLKSVFLTLKGDQKYTEKYLDIYNNYIIK